MIKRQLVPMMASVVLVLSLVSCTPEPVSFMHGSRVELYNSVREIAADSSKVVVVDVLEQEVIYERLGDLPSPITYTVSTVAVRKEFSPTGLGIELPNAGPHVEGDRLLVRQMGTKESDGPATILRPDASYLLFLTPSLLPGELASQFYVTGGSAGIYVATDNFFEHGPFEEGDTLPGTLTADDLLQ